MKIQIDIKAIKFYAWGGVAYLLLWLAIDLSSTPDNFSARIINNIWLTAFIVVINFVFFELTLPFIRSKRITIFVAILLFVLGLSVMLVLYSVGMYFWRFIGIRLYVYTSLKDFASVKEGAFYIFPHGLLSLFFFGSIKHLYDHVKLKETAQYLLIEKQAAELNYLKSQTNPHFLFNTLNNIYALARDKSDLAPESILRLSKILRFMLYETSGDYIIIEEELKIIKDYIALEKLRYDEVLRINLNSSIDDLKQRIPPLLLIPLVENAFKHGVSETRDFPFIDIQLSLNKQQLTFSVLNSTETHLNESGIKENIGLTNLRRQLELLYTDYHLAIEQKEVTFTAELKINLTSHV